MKPTSIILVMLAIVIQVFGENLSETIGGVEYKLFDGNQIRVWIGNNGTMVSHVPTGNAGLEWPISTGKTAVFSGGLWISAGKIDGKEEIRTAICEYTSEFESGLLDAETVDNQIYIINDGDDSSNPDWLNWPVDLGAPWRDVNANGNYDPDIDHPSAKGSQYAWYVINDGGSSHINLYGTDSLGLEIRAAIFGFNDRSSLENTMFYEWNIHNAGVHDLDSVFIGIWMDVDIGGASDDYGGCIPEMDLTYAYNGDSSDETYGTTPPAVGAMFLQTPLVKFPGSTGYTYQKGVVEDHMNLPMTSSLIWRCSGPLCAPNSAAEAYNQMNGLDNEGNPILSPDSTSTKFMFDGDPVNDGGWTEANSLINPGDRYFLMSTGPFELKRGQSQDIASALMIADRSNNLNALTALKETAVYVKNEWLSSINAQLVSVNETNPVIPGDYVLGQAFPNPFNPGTTIPYTLPQTEAVNFTLFDVNGKVVRHWEIKNQSAGNHYLDWNGRDESGAPVATGVYFGHISAGDFHKTIKMVMLK